MSDKEIIINNNSISIIENIDNSSVSQTLTKIVNFQKVIKSQLKDGYDYGLVPGCGNKPSLFKPGAEKINMLFGTYPEYEMLDRIADFKNEFFNYEIKCKILKDGRPVSEGVGSCNNYEKKFKTQDAASIANTILKMAKKRAFVDATLQLASLSDLFTQDLEDMDIAETSNKTVNTTKKIQEVKEVNNIEDARKVILTGGKYVGKTLGEVMDDKDGNSYIVWCYDNNKLNDTIKKAYEIIKNNKIVETKKHTPYEDLKVITDNDLPF